MLDRTPGTITPNQASYITDLVTKKDLSSDKLTHDQRKYLYSGAEHNFQAMSKYQASKCIELLLSLPNNTPTQSLPVGATNAANSHPVQVLEKREPPVVTTDNVISQNPRAAQGSELTELEDKIEPGFYFVVDPTRSLGDTNNGEYFFRVTKPEPPSKWAGRVFIETRGGDFHYKVKDMPRRIAVLTEILKDPVTAMNNYGMRLGVCGCCGRTLTARDSRLRGLGPICAARIMGAPTESQLELLDRLGLRSK
jgi:hypothetical protein